MYIMERLALTLWTKRELERERVVSGVEWSGVGDSTEAIYRTSGHM